MPLILTTLALLGLSSVAAFVAQALGVPLPFLIGPLLFAGSVAITSLGALPSGYRFPPRLRLVFVAVIGLTIGAQVTPDLFADTSTLALSAVALTIFVVLAHGFGFAVLRYLGRYDAPTAFYASAPGGLFEAIAMGEAAGANPALLTLQQFLRIIVVVTLLPIGLSLYLGAPVGSAAGMTLATDNVPLSALPFGLLAGAVGLGLGHVLRFPAKQLTGPMAVAALLSLTGLFHVDVPHWLINAAQIVVGTALGMRFAGLSVRRVAQGFWLTLCSVGGMLVLSAGFALMLTGPLNQPFDVMLISFAPGGVTEMSLIALSLSANPALVTLHHVFRILITVLGLALSARWFAARF